MTANPLAPLRPGDVVRAKVQRVEVFGIFCEHGDNEILVLIPETSWIPCIASCEQFAEVGDELEIKITIVHHDEERKQIAGSIRGIHPENDPWDGKWRLSIGDTFEATVVRWVKKADRCRGSGGYLLALRPGAFVMLCGQEPGKFSCGDKCVVVITSVDHRRRHVGVELKQ
jgi:ribosomal protein S1